MKLLLLDLYKLIYRWTNKSTLAIISSSVYVAILDVAVMYGLGLLMPGGLAKVLTLMSRFPVSIGTVILLTLFNIWIMSPFKNIKKEKAKPVGYISIIMYTLLAGVIYVYSKYGNLIF